MVDTVLRETDLRKRAATIKHFVVIAEVSYLAVSFRSSVNCLLNVTALSSVTELFHFDAHRSRSLYHAHTSFKTDLGDVESEDDIKCADSKYSSESGAKFQRVPGNFENCRSACVPLFRYVVTSCLITYIHRHSRCFPDKLDFYR